MKIMVRIDPVLYAAIEAQAAREVRTFSNMIQVLLGRHLRALAEGKTFTPKGPARLGSEEVAKNVRVTGDMYAAIKREADAEARSMSMWIRLALEATADVA